MLNSTVRWRKPTEKDVVDTMQTGAFVITFRRHAHLQAMLAALLAQTRPPDTILVVDNAADPAAQAIAQGFPADVVRYTAMATNVGSAGGAAHGFQTLADEGYEWVYWGDDDDPPLTRDTFARLLAVAEQVADLPDVGGIAAVGHPFDWKQGVVSRLDDSALTGIPNVDVFSGNGQSFFRREAILTAGPTDARLFIDFEDTEISLRMRRQGYRLLVDGALMHQYRELTGRIGYVRPAVAALPDEIRYLWRRYYVTRNYIYCMAYRFARPDLARRQTLRTLAKATRGWQKGPAYGRVYQTMLLRGVWDGWRGRMGRTVMPQAKYNG